MVNQRKLYSIKNDFRFKIMPAKKKDSAKTAKKGGAVKAPTTDPAGAPSAASTVELATVKAAKGSKKGKKK
ncbi:uncharacterized protein DMAD_02773 [Drosophila madeirensis]|uniref:Uncharacterized protein n=1 Tax=Drosophila madeirensis TaxID=30013 RepID=A0AAU9G515_DROMD